MATVTATAMVRPPPPAGPPPPGPPRPRPPAGRPPPPKGPPPKMQDRISNNNINMRKPPPPPPSGLKRAPMARPQVPPQKRQRAESVSIMAPVVLRDVTVFEKKQQVGQGTYGSVFVGADKVTGGIVALKRINTEQEENGFPITAIREVKILKALNHPNIVDLKEIVTSKEQGEIPKNVFMVFEYLEFDLTGILETPEIRMSQDHIKSWSWQLLKGVHYMHMNKIVHRDLKSSNLLINRRGELKIADLGLARSWNSEMKRLTNRVITLWYRPPELLLGCMQYSTQIDMWSVGCIVAEMFRRSGLLKGGNEATQLDLIFRTCGHPTLEDWPNINQTCPLWKNYAPKAGETPYPRRIREAVKQQLPNAAWMTDNAKDLIDNLLILNPDNRWSAAKALESAEYFFELPMVKRANELNMNFGVDSVHEWESRKRHEKVMAHRRSQVQASSNRAKPPPPPPGARLSR